MYALSATFVGLALGLFALLQHMLHDRITLSAFPLLLGGIILILLRGQLSKERYWRLRQHVGLMSGHWMDHMLVLLYGLTLFFGVALVATLLAGGAAMLIGAIVGA